MKPPVRSSAATLGEEMIENIKKHKGTFILSCCIILIAILSAKQYLLTGSITYRRWTSPEGTGLVMSGWQALGVLVGEAAIGTYGLLLSIKKGTVSKGK